MRRRLGMSGKSGSTYKLSRCTYSVSMSEERGGGGGLLKIDSLCAQLLRSHCIFSGVFTVSPKNCVPRVHPCNTPYTTVAYILYCTAQST